MVRLPIACSAERNTMIGLGGICIGIPTEEIALIECIGGTFLNVYCST